MAAGMLAAAVLLSAGATRAQVNVEVLRKDLKEHGVGAKLDATLSGHRGNTEGLVAGGSSLLGVQGGRHLSYFAASANHAQYDGESVSSNAFAHLRYNFEFLPWLWGEVFTQLEADEFRHIALRWLVGSGPRFGLYQTPEFAAFYGTGYMLEYNRVAAGTERVRPDYVHRFNNYASLIIDLDRDRVAVQNTLYYQPRFDAFNDWRLLEVLSLDFKLTNLLRAGIHLMVRRETPVPDGLKTTDLTLKNSLGLEF